MLVGVEARCRWGGISSRREKDVVAPVGRRLSAAPVGRGMSPAVGRRMSTAPVGRRTSAAARSVMKAGRVWIARIGVACRYRSEM